VQGYWYDETQAYAARRRGEDFDPMRFATLETLTLSPLPCWKHLPEEKRRKLIADLIAEIEAEAAVRRQRTGSQVLGASAVRGQHPYDRPKKSKKSPAPLFHAASKAIHQELYEMYGWFVAAFREASEKLRAGNRLVPFPVGRSPRACRLWLDSRAKSLNQILSALVPRALTEVYLLGRFSEKQASDLGLRLPFIPHQQVSRASRLKLEVKFRPSCASKREAAGPRMPHFSPLTWHLFLAPIPGTYWALLPDRN